MSEDNNRPVNEAGEEASGETIEEAANRQAEEIIREATECVVEIKKEDDQINNREPVEADCKANEGEDQLTATSQKQTTDSSNNETQKQLDEEETQQQQDEQQANTMVLLERADKSETQTQTDSIKEVVIDKQQKESKSSVGTSPMPVTETPEVSSTRNDEAPRSARSSGRRPSYNSGRGYAGGYQNYGLTYLPYKSNFEPSEDARRRADEFFKTLKL